MQNITDKTKCSGCGACVQCCPAHAIELRVDGQGFLRPFISQKDCLNCGKCIQICPVNAMPAAYIPLDVYAYRTDNDDVLMRSTSGGAFTLLSDFVLKREGVVYGARFDEHLNLRHTCATTPQERDYFRGAKYLQSDTSSCFEDVHQDLQAGKWVLFSGTPCQVAGLKNFLGKSYDKLILVDLVCHGIPSTGVWQDFIHILTQYFTRPISFIFRYKPTAWHGVHLHVTFENGRVLQDDNYLLRSFTYLLFYNYILRPSCKTCPHKNSTRQGDFTIGDFWGYDARYPKFKDEKGVSLLLLNTPKAQQIFTKLSPEGYCKKESLEEFQFANINKPRVTYPDVTLFWKKYAKYGYLYVARKYTDFGICHRIFSNARKLLSKIKQCIKKKITIE